MSEFYLVSFAVFVGACLGAVITLLKQPPLIGYLFTGLILASLGFINSESSNFQTLSQFGVTLLLFLVGLELSFKELKNVGKVALFTGIGQIVFTSFVGFLLVLLLGFSFLSSLYISIALTFSSTVIIIKLLGEKKDLGSLYGKIAVGFLLVQDFVAIIILMLLSGFTDQKEVGFLRIVLIALKGSILLYATVFLSRFFFPYFMAKVRLSSEMVFVTSIAWALGLASFVSLPGIGFTSELGGFLAGLSLANSKEHYQIISRIRPVRDFFVIVFFIYLGTKLAVGNILAVFFPAVVLSVFVLLGNPIIVMIIMGFLGFRKRTSFLAGLTVAQISEFSLIIVVMGEKIGHLDQGVVQLVASVGVITMTVSTYMILYGERLYRYLSSHLSVFERKHVLEQPTYDVKTLKQHILLLGCNRTGRFILPSLQRLKNTLLVADFNPQVVNQLTAEGVDAIYGDVVDDEFLQMLQLEDAAVIISTIGNLQDNLLLLENLRHVNKRPLVIVTAYYQDDALKLYELKADYVLLPFLVGGEHLSHMIESHGIDQAYFKKLGRQQFDILINER